jgi:hypothetical protein
MASITGIEIINNGASLKIIMDGETRLFLKQHIREINVLRPSIVKLDLGSGPLRNIFINYPEVINPRTASPEALRDAINLMLKNEMGDIQHTVETINSKIFFEPLIEDETVPKTIYKGYAAPGSKTNEAVWAIEKIVNKEGIIYHLWANGNKNFDNVWDDRQRCDYKEIPEIQPAV